MSNAPISQQWYEAAKRWVDAEAAADLLESTKSAVLSQMMSMRVEASVAAKEAGVKASGEWMRHVEKTAAARKAANLAKVEKDYLEMLAWEARSHEATERTMAKL